uniref:Transglutaminase 1 like 1 n=1 Tax=Paramormyrops kingsleyae TaxID=1676925 RepID=A0A3B3RG20_9TELE
MQNILPVQASCSFILPAGSSLPYSNRQVYPRGWVPLALIVRSVDLLQSKTDQNRRDHHTDLYHNDDLIVRRGQTFQIALELSRPFNPNTDKLRLELTTGRNPVVAKGTHVIVPLVEDLDGGRWEAKIVEQSSSRVLLSVNSSAKAAIGRYQLTVATQCPQGTSTHEPGSDIYMLFNPWCQDDTVYMDDDSERTEYVLRDTGRIYYGTENQIGARTWNFGQQCDPSNSAFSFTLSLCLRSIPLMTVGSLREIGRGTTWAGLPLQRGAAAWTS